MRRASVLIVGLLVVLASCGSTPDVPDDTEAVAPQPLAEVPATPVITDDEPAHVWQVPTPQGVAVPPAAKVGFAGGDRFIVFAQEDEPSFSVFDRDRGEIFRVLGAPIGEATGGGNRFFDMGLAEGPLRWTFEGDREGRILVRSAGGVQLVDLDDRGRMVAAWRGEPVATSIAPDGKTFSVASSDALHIVRASDGAIATFALADGEHAYPSWGDADVHWVSGAKLTRVDRTTLRATVVRASANDARFATSSDATVVAIASEGAVSVFAAGSAAPIVRVPTVKEMAELVVDDAGTSVVWIERAPDSEEGHLHAVDVAARTHVSFKMEGSGCTSAPESIVGVREGNIMTDPSCVIGCPSVRWTHRTLTYDAHTGKVVGDSSITDSVSFNEAQAELRGKVDTLAAKLGVQPDAMLGLPGTGADFLVETPRGIRTAQLDDATISLALEDSKEAPLSALTSSPDGEVVAGIVAGRMRAWSTTTGHALIR